MWWKNNVMGANTGFRLFFFLEYPQGCQWDRFPLATAKQTKKLQLHLRKHKELFCQSSKVRENYTKYISHANNLSFLNNTAAGFIRPTGLSDYYSFFSKQSFNTQLAVLTWIPRFMFLLCFWPTLCLRAYETCQTAYECWIEFLSLQSLERWNWKDLKEKMCKLLPFAQCQFYNCPECFSHWPWATEKRLPSSPRTTVRQLFFFSRGSLHDLTY